MMKEIRRDAAHRVPWMILAACVALFAEALEGCSSPTQRPSAGDAATPVPDQSDAVTPTPDHAPVPAPRRVWVLDPEKVDLTAIGFSTYAKMPYELATLFDVLAGRANQKELRVVLTRRNVMRSSEGNYFWLNYLKKSLKTQKNQTLVFEDKPSASQVGALIRSLFKEIIAYPENPVDWSRDVSRVPKELPLGDGVRNWLDEKHNFNRHLATNFVNLRNALPVPQGVAKDPKFRAAIGDLPVVTLQSVVESIDKAGWALWQDSRSAHHFILDHVASQLNPQYVCISRAFDICVAHNGLSIGHLSASLYYPKDLELFDTILARQGARLPAGVFGKTSGWTGTEDVYGCVASRHHYGIVFEMNSGFSSLERMPTEHSSYNLNDQDDPAHWPMEARTYSDKRRYLAIVLSDGNADQMIGVYGQQWTTYHTSSLPHIPITWQIRPEVLYHAPIIADYLYKTRFQSDTFMMGPSGPSYVHFTGLRAATEITAFGAYLNAAKTSFGTAIYEAWNGYHPRIDAIFANGKNAKNPYDATKTNPFPSLISAETWDGDPKKILDSILACNLSPFEVAHFPRISLLDQIRSASKMDGLVARSMHDHIDLFDQHPTAYVNEESGLWHYYPHVPSTETSPESLNVVAIRDRIITYFTGGRQFQIATFYPHELGKGTSIRIAELQNLAQLLTKDGVTLVTMGQLLALKRQCRHGSTSPTLCL